MEYRRFENTIIARIDKGEEILEQVKIIALTENIQLASVQALGAVANLRWEYSEQNKKFISPMNFKVILKLYL